MYINTTWKQFGFIFPADDVFECVLQSASCRFNIYSTSEFLLHNIVCDDKQQELQYFNLPESIAHQQCCEISVSLMLQDHISIL